MKEVKYKGNYMEMSEELIDGHVYERVKLRSGVVVLPVDGDKIMFIREYRKVEASSRINLVGGWMDKDGLTSLQVAQEELAEEAGKQASEWELFYQAQSPDATVESNIDYFIAKGISELEEPVENPDGDVIEDIFWMNEEEYFEKLENGEIPWIRNGVVVLMLFRKLRQSSYESRK